MNRPHASAALGRHLSHQPCQTFSQRSCTTRTQPSCETRRRAAKTRCAYQRDVEQARPKVPDSAPPPPNSTRPPPPPPPPPLPVPGLVHTYSLQRLHSASAVQHRLFDTSKDLTVIAGREPCKTNLTSFGSHRICGIWLQHHPAQGARSSEAE